MFDHTPERNYNGQPVSNQPTEKLINPPKKKRNVPAERKTGASGGKRLELGDRTRTGR